MYRHDSPVTGMVTLEKLAPQNISWTLLVNPKITYSFSFQHTCTPINAPKLSSNLFHCPVFSCTHVMWMGCERDVNGGGGWVGFRLRLLLRLQLESRSGFEKRSNFPVSSCITGELESSPSQVNTNKLPSRGMSIFFVLFSVLCLPSFNYVSFTPS